MPTTFGSFLKGLKNLFHSGVHNLAAALGSLAHSIEINGGDFLITAAMDAVVAAETKGGTGKEKLQAAQDAVVADLTSKGIAIAMNAVNGAIESAVAQHKENLAAMEPPIVKPAT